MMNINPALVEAGKISSTINLYAPIDGSVTKVLISNGSYVSASDNIINIVNTEHIHLELSVFEKDILDIKKGQPIQFKIPEASRETFNAEVYLVGNSIDDVKRTIKVHGHIDDADDQTFVTGMFVEANIITNTNKSRALPIQAVAEINGKHFIMAVLEHKDQQYTFEKIQVTIGKQTEDHIEITNPEALNNKTILARGISMLLFDTEE